MTSVVRDFLSARFIVCACLLYGFGRVTSKKLSLAIFYPKSCTLQTPIYEQTVQLAIASAMSTTQKLGLDVVVSAYDSCQESEAITQLVRITDSKTHDIIVGPSNTGICEVSARLADKSRTPLVSWSCQDNILGNRDLYSTFARTVPPMRDVSASLGAMLKHFQWKYIALVTQDDPAYVSQANDMHFALSQNGVDVDNFLEVNSQAPDIGTLFRKIESRVKAIVLFTDLTILKTILIKLDSEKDLLGRRALFYVDSLHALNTTSGLTMDLFPGHSRDATRNAEEALLIVKAHPFYINAQTEVTSPEFEKLSRYNINMYTAVTLAVQGAISAVQNSQQVAPGTIAQFAQNFSVTGVERSKVDFISGQSVIYFSLWDYSVVSGRYQAVLGTNGSHVTSLRSIHWPSDSKPDVDACAFDTCNVTIEPIYILVIVLVVVSVAGGIGTGVALFVRRRMHRIEMEKGPNKILLNSKDLIFFVPRSKSPNAKSFYSNSVHLMEKPDLIRGSEPSMSVDTVFGENMEYGDTARYNGDLVFVKELHVKEFEMKSNVRNYIKTLRDIRHENINPFIGCYDDQLHPSFVFEYCSRKSLEDVIANEDIKLDWDFKLSLLTDLVKGMRYFHSNHQRAHGRLKSGNLVIDSRWVLKITDYGLYGLGDKYPYRKHMKSKDLLWTAPELLRDPVLMQKGTQKADVYSFGIIVQEVIVRGHPFCMLNLNAEEIIKKIKKPPPLCRPSVSQQMAPPQYIQIMKQCWAENPDIRPTFDNINQQFKEINKGKKLNIVDTMFKMLEKYSNDLEDIVRDRTLQLEEEKKKTEHLLSQMLPKSVAESLLLGRPVEAEDFKEVTIYFSDIVGFTTISAMSTPRQVVDLLNDLYTMFDNSIDNYDVYKVETIGDAYMVVSGLPVPNGDRHAGEICNMSLEILSGCGQFKIRHMPDIPMRLRIGLHSGPCVAGVVGLRMPRYCLFGDTVNTASRMESTGSAFRIHLSGSTKEKLDKLGGYHLEYRGEVELKGKGIHKTYWLVGKDGYDKPLPQPPAATGGDNHGLGAYMDVDKLNQANKDNKANVNNGNDVDIKSKTETSLVLSNRDLKNRDLGTQPPAKSVKTLNKLSHSPGVASARQGVVDVAATRRAMDVVSAAVDDVHCAQDISIENRSSDTSNYSVKTATSDGGIASLTPIVIEDKEDLCLK